MLHRRTFFALFYCIVAVLFATSLTAQGLLTGTVTDRALHFQLAIVRPYNIIAQRKAQARPLPRRFGGEKGLEYFIY